MARMTDNQREYQRQVKRITRFMRELRAQGFEFLPGYTPLPPKPPRITKKQLELIKSVKPKQAREKAIITPDWYKEGYATPPQRRAAERARRKAKKSGSSPILTPSTPMSSIELPNPIPISTVVLDNVRAEIAKWTPVGNWSEYWSKVKENDKNILASMLDGYIAREGESVIASRLEKRANEVNELLQFVLYASGGKYGRSEINFKLARFAEILKGNNLTLSENKMLSDLQESIDSVPEDLL